MENYILNDLSFDKLQPQNWEAVDKTFEFLCADFMKIKYKLSKVPLPSQNDNYPWIEWEPIEKDWLYYWYQAKFWNDAFESNKWFYKSFISLKNSLDKNIYKLSILCLFSKKDFPTSNREKRNNEFKSFEYNNKIKIDKYFWIEFISELKKIEYVEILHKYFDIDKIKSEIYEKCENKDDVCNTKLNNDINNVEKWFEWDYYISDLELAKKYQKKYSYKKLSYSTHPFILKRFEDVENWIADELFDLLDSRTYTNLDNYIDRCIKDLDNTEAKNKYKVELESIMNNKPWIFVNYWTQWLSCLDYISKNEIKFKNKKYGWSI